MFNLAPIVLFTYNLPHHTESTINALKANHLAIGSDLIIYSDAPKDSESFQPVNDVREFLKSVSGFKSIRIIEQSENQGLAKSIINGASDVVNKYGKVIVLEDDIVTSPSFLSFINDSLEYYQNERKVFTISGYSNIDIPAVYTRNIYFSHISTSWGWATWSDRWNSVVWDDKYYENILDNKKMVVDIQKKVGNQRIKMLRMQVKGEINSWAIRRLFSQLIQRKMTAFPRISLVKNIGNDGTGIHCNDNSEFDFKNKITESNIFEEVPFNESKLINKLIYNKNNLNLLSSIINKLIKIMAR
jgi:hypothetical protein